MDCMRKTPELIDLGYWIGVVALELLDGSSRIEAIRLEFVMGLELLDCN